MGCRDHCDWRWLKTCDAGHDHRQAREEREEADKLADKLLALVSQQRSDHDLCRSDS